MRVEEIAAIESGALPRRTARVLLAFLFAAFLLLAFLPQAGATYSHSKRITIDHARVAGDSNFTDFPVLVRITDDEDLKTVANGGQVHHPSGYDIIFTDSDRATPLDHEIETYDGGAGTLIAWVRIPTVYHWTDTIFYLTFGDSSVTSTAENPDGVWGSDYAGVWHLKETAGGFGAILDSSGNGNHATTVNDPTLGATGQVDGAVQNGGTSYLEVQSESPFDMGSGVTVSAWLRVDGFTRQYQALVTKGDGTYRLTRYAGNNTMCFQINTWLGLMAANGSIGVNDGQPHYVVGTFDGNSVRLYVDGVLDDYTTFSSTGLNTNDFKVAIGENLQATGKQWKGVIDEVRILDAARSNHWIETEYNNQMWPNKAEETVKGFLSVEGAVTADDHGNDCAGATVVACDSAMAGEIEQEVDVDYFRLEMSGPGTITVSSEGNTDTRGELLDSNCAIVLSDENGQDGTNFRIERSVDASEVGTYYVAVRHAASMTGAYTLRVECVRIYTIVAGAGQGGTITPPGEVPVTAGESQSFTITPGTDYVIEQILVDGESLEGVGGMTGDYTYTFSVVNENHSITAVFVEPSQELCQDISDVPLEVNLRTAPANILFVVDDSGSMDGDILMPEYSTGQYMDWYLYVFNVGDNVYDYSDMVLDAGDTRLHWKTQCSDDNRMYYNPGFDYEPWPKGGGDTRAPADLNYPRSHPAVESVTLNLSETYDSVSVQEVIIDERDEDRFSTEGTTGSWDWATDSQAHMGEYAYSSQSNAHYTATWTPSLVGGEYEVYIRYSAAENRATAVVYTVNHANGSRPFPKNQRLNGGEWVYLDTFTFEEGKGSVELSAEVSNNDQEKVCADAVKFVPVGALTIPIKNAHYYVRSEEAGKPYLVVVDGSIKYYALNDDGDHVVEPGELVPVTTPPSDVVTGRTYDEERRNFANWFSYHRRRMFSAIHAMSKMISSMRGVRIGFYFINYTNGCGTHTPQEVVNVKTHDEDYTAALLDKLWNLGSCDSATPLRNGLDWAGKYFDASDGDSPYDSLEEGGACQNAFAIVVTDGYWNDRILSNGDIGDEDGDGYSQTLADVAMSYYRRDLAPALPNQLPTSRRDPAAHQHMVTFSVSFGVGGTLNPDHYEEKTVLRETGEEMVLVHKETGQEIAWPDPHTAGDKAKIDDVWHAAFNGRGKFLSAESPSELSRSLLEIMMEIELRVASGAAVSVNGDELYGKLGDGIVMYQTSYSTDGWIGDVKAYSVNGATGEVVTTSYLWSAAGKLRTRSWDSRLIATHDGTGGVPFQIGPSGISQAQQSLLDADEAEAGALLRYLRGDSSNEEQKNGSYRNRFGNLGDIVNSSPYYRDGVVYAGANDGMLHAFDGNSGTELFAYVPNLVFENLRLLANPEYAHRYYVDLTPEAREVILSGAKKTVLVGGLGKGGKGYYALDVSNPSAITSEGLLAERVMWEYPRAATYDEEKGNVGYTFSEPTIVPTNASSAPWVVIVGNGYNSDNGHALLLILDVSSGSLVKSIDTGVETCNGLSSPVAIDPNGDGLVDYVYAGDLKGNLWKFDLTGSDPSGWGVAYRDGNTPMPLFSARGKTGLPQPITSRPDVMFHCEKHGYLVCFGTGIYLSGEDREDTSPQTIYGIWDFGDDTDEGEYLGSFTRTGSPPFSNSSLAETVTLLEQVQVDWRSVNGKNLRTLSNNSAEWETADDLDGVGNPDPVKHVGWFFDLPGQGERVIDEVMIRDGKLIAISFTEGTWMCGAGGTSIVHELDACTGARLVKAQFDINGDGLIDERDLINLGDTENPNWVVPTGIQQRGRVHPPAILRQEGFEVKYFSSSFGSIESLRERAARLGIFYWLDIQK